MLRGIRAGVRPWLCTASSSRHLAIVDALLVCPLLAKPFLPGQHLGMTKRRRSCQLLPCGGGDGHEQSRHAELMFEHATHEYLPARNLRSNLIHTTDGDTPFLAA
jgi:hypothetical protein